jgi:hypothetical protein
MEMIKESLGSPLLIIRNCLARREKYVAVSLFRRPREQTDPLARLAASRLFHAEQSQRWDRQVEEREVQHSD